MFSPAIFDGRHVAVTSAINVYRGSVPMILDEIASVVTRDDAPFIAVLYGEDLGASVSLMLDLRTDKVVYTAGGTSPELEEKWATIIRLLHDAEVLFDTEMNAA